MDILEVVHNFNTLIERDKTRPGDAERTALFWILSGNTDLFEKSSSIYDFDDHFIKPDVLENGIVDFCSGSRSLVKLGFNLFNSFPADVINTFCTLDSDNFELAIEAIKIRFNHDEDVKNFDVPTSPPKKAD